MGFAAIALLGAIGLVATDRFLSPLFALCYGTFAFGLLLSRVVKQIPRMLPEVRYDISYSLYIFHQPIMLGLVLACYRPAFPTVEGAIALAPRNTLPETAVAILSALAAKSFLIVDWQESAVTYRLLETMRAYLSEQLRSNGEENDAKHRHAMFMCTLLEGVGKPLTTVGAREWRAKVGRCLEDVLCVPKT